MKESILSLLQTVRLIYSVSKFYNTSERTSSLMVKVTMQLVEVTFFLEHSRVYASFEMSSKVYGMWHISEFVITLDHMARW